VLDSSVEGLTAQQVYGGSRIGGTENTAAYDGNIYINAVSGTYGKIYGGGFVAGTDCLELRDGTNYISISGATVTGKVTGGTQVGKNGK